MPPPTTCKPEPAVPVLNVRLTRGPLPWGERTSDCSCEVVPSTVCGGVAGSRVKAVALVAACTRGK